MTPVCVCAPTYTHTHTHTSVAIQLFIQQTFIMSLCASHCSKYLEHISEQKIRKTKQIHTKTKTAVKELTLEQWERDH